MKMGFFRALVSSLIAALWVASLTSCTKGFDDSGSPNPDQGNPVTSPGTKTAVKNAVSGKVKITEKARIGVLYYQDRPAHRQALLDWLAAAPATVLFESAKFGYLEAEMDWTTLEALIETSGKVGLDDPSIFKLELEDDEPAEAVNSGSGLRGIPVPTPLPPPEEPNDGNSLFFGPAHSAGYGAKVEEFRTSAAHDLGVKVDDLAGQGIKVAIFDAGIDLSRSDVFQDRIEDFFIGDELQWRKGADDLAAFAKKMKWTPHSMPPGLEDLAKSSTLRFVYLDESTFIDATGKGTDFNGTGSGKDIIPVAVYIGADGLPQARVRPQESMSFGDAISDFSTSQKPHANAVVDLYTGHAYSRPHPNALAFKFRVASTPAGPSISVAFVGLPTGAEHGTSNLHMVGGNFSSSTDPNDPSAVKYQGVAPGVSFIGMQTWGQDTANYGSKWIPLARSIIQAAEAGADVLDLDIYTPGTRAANDMLSKLLCRVTSKTSIVPVIAAHNYGPLPNSVQSMAESGCALGVGASHTAAALRYLRNDGSIDPKLKNDDDVLTAPYSGRGFGMNGLYKPDIISPAYGYAAYGPHFIRFSGTSGATPTTSGMVALLKQAARKKGVELGFEQIRFLLQAGSHPTDPANARDGYGYADLNEVWSIFNSLYDPKTKSFSLYPLAFNGQRYLQFEGRPNIQTIDLTLERVKIPDTPAGPVKMKFWIEYGGASPPGAHWLRFYDRLSGKQVDHLEQDAPLLGENARISLNLNLGDSDWNVLPTGDHIAIVKGVRIDGGNFGNRAVDFLQPVSFSKPDESVDTVMQTVPLYADEYQNFTFSSVPGESIFITGSTLCNGSPIQGGAAGNVEGSLQFQADTEASYPNASTIMNGYAPLYLSELPIELKSSKTVIKFNISRTQHLKCDGAVEANLRLRRVGIKPTLKTPEIRVTEVPPSRFAKDPTAPPIFLNEMTLPIELALTGIGISDSETFRGISWKLRITSPTLVLRHVVTGAYALSAPDSLRSLRVVPVDQTKFQAVLAVETPNGTEEIIQSQFLPDERDAGGFGSISTDLSGKYTGLALETIIPGSSIFMEPPVAKSNSSAFFPGFSDDPAGDAASAATLELRFDLASALSLDKTAITLSGDGVTQPIVSWIKPDSRTVTIHTATPNAKPDALSAFPGNDWSATMEFTLVLQEAMAGDTGTVAYGPYPVWQGKVEVPTLFTN